MIGDHLIPNMTSRIVDKRSRVAVPRGGCSGGMDVTSMYNGRWIGAFWS